MSLKKKAISGVKWTTASTAINSVTDFIRISILARLLDATNFGLIGMITVVIGFAQAFADMGISNAIIYRQDVTKDQLSSLYWLNIFSGTVIFGLVMAFSPLIVNFYKEPYLIFIMPWAALTFLITPIGQQFQILLQKELKFDNLAKIEVLSNFCGTLVAVATAIKGQGVFSIVWGMLVNTTIRTFSLAVLGWRDWRPGLHFKLKDIKGYVSFGLYQMGERSLNYLSANADYLFVGRFLGARILGIYTLAYQIVVTPFMRINPILTRVAFPVFSKKQSDNSALRRGYLDITKLISIAIFPILAGLAVTAPLFVNLIYGSNWVMAIPLIQILAVIGMIKTLANPLSSVLLAKGRADIGFKWNFAAAVTNVIVFWIVARNGVFFVAWAWVVLCILFFAFGFSVLNRVIGIKWKEYISVIYPSILMSLCMGAIVYICNLLFNRHEVNKIFSLISLILIGVSVYGFLILLLESEYLKNLLALFFKKEKEEAQCRE